MATVTVPVSKKLKQEIDEIKEVNWRQKTRLFLEEQVKKRKALKVLDEATQNSELTEQDAVELGRELNKRIWKKHYQKMI